MLMTNKYLLIGAAAAALAVLLIVKKKGAAAAVGQDLGRAAADVAVGVVQGATEGVVYGVGDAMGIPRTNMTECERAIAEGRTLDASFACPASDFLSYMNPFK
ncbi:hypothetical protein [Pseudoduganella namucuonensis]|uniref:Uncharacterized protein n=1 Tax=Pseudoduganella namucuonensis TaxID=1035707 RepID=A0A1I7M7N1_9BURK|nr:hypothetical protein [Pseudoduganella namucuonensis]SFV17897.1 hypothetical protein SAMN05216552_108015 [Pseudoduganella namucuonensis]